MELVTGQKFLGFYFGGERKPLECSSLYKDPRVLDRLLEAHGWKYTDLSGGSCIRSGAHDGGL